MTPRRVPASQQAQAERKELIADLVWQGAQGHADADLTATLADGKGQHAVGP